MKRTISCLLVIMMLLSMTACGKKNVEQSDDGAVYYMGNDVDKSCFDNPENSLDVDKIYSSIEYTEEMLYGRYWLNDYEKDLKEFVKTAEFVDLEYWYPYGDGELKTEKLSKLPVKAEIGVPHLYSHKIKVDRTHHWAYLYFAEEDGNYNEVLCSFEVKDNNIIFTPVDYYEEITDENYKVKGIKYTIGKDSLTYNFSLKGPNLQLSAGDKSVSLRSFGFSDNSSSISLSGYRAQNSATFENIDTISAGIYSDGKSGYTYLNDINGELIYNPPVSNAVKYTENGVLTLYWTEKDAEGEPVGRCHQFVCLGSDYSLTLIDNDAVYSYIESYSSREMLALTDGLTADEVVGIGELSESELKKIAETKANLLDDLTKEFAAQGINVTVNRTTGELAMDASVLFGGDSAVITDAGKTLLNKFIKAYTTIAYNEKYNGFISKTLVEGHTAPVSGSTYESGLPLSEQRANNVKEYCLSSDTGVDTSKLSTALEAVGLSNSKPVYGSDGKVDMAACRRVSFRFIVDINSIK